MANVRQLAAGRAPATAAADRREFVMAGGQMRDTEFRTFNDIWISAARTVSATAACFVTFVSRSDRRPMPSLASAA